MNSRLRRERKQIIEAKHGDYPVTGWEPELMQDASKGLSYWLANQPNARQEAREAADQIKERR